MERFDVIVIGSGSGMLVASAAVDQGFRDGAWLSMEKWAAHA